MHDIAFLLAQTSQDGELHKNVMTLCLGDWEGLNWLRPFVLLLVAIVFCCPLPCFGGYSLIQLLNLVALPFVISERWKK